MNHTRAVKLHVACGLDDIHTHSVWPIRHACHHLMWCERVCTCKHNHKVVLVGGWSQHTHIVWRVVAPQCVSMHTRSLYRRQVKKRGTAVMHLSAKGVLGLSKVQGRQQHMCRQVGTSSSTGLQAAAVAPPGGLLLQLALLSCKVLDQCEALIALVW